MNPQLIIALVILMSLTACDRPEQSTQAVSESAAGQVIADTVYTNCNNHSQCTLN